MLEHRSALVYVRFNDEPYEGFMTTRRALLRTAGVASLACVADPLGLAIRSAAAFNDPVAPWRGATATTDPDPRVRALAWAVLAPNPHNRQPWLVKLPDSRPDEVWLHCDLDRRLPVTDPLDRQILIGFGCFAELFRLAAA